MKNSIHLRLIAVLAIAVLLTSCGAAMKATPAESADASSPASVTLTYQTDTGEVEGPTVQVDPGGRESVNVGDTVTTYDVSTRVASDNPVIAERAVYYNNRTCAHSSIGVTEPADTWYLAEGATYGGFETWVLVANPGEGEPDPDPDPDPVPANMVPDPIFAFALALCLYCLLE